MKAKDPRDPLSRLGPLFGGEQVTVSPPEPAGPHPDDRLLWRPGDPSSKKKIRIGTSGYSFKDWVGPFYPEGTASRQMLPYYAARFPAVEVNVTYYRLPEARTFRQMETKTPGGFEFFVKLQKELTHGRKRDPADVEAFADSVGPLVEAGKYRGALAQFPFSFRNTAENRQYLEWLSGRYPWRPLVMEFRHDSWNREETYGLLENEGLDFCCVDEPPLEGLFPPQVRLTGETGYIRFHGRNEKTWWEGSGSQRYNYLYSQEELAEWVGKVRELAAQAKVTYVFFNNCHAGRAIQNARMMGDLLKLAHPS